MYVEIKKLKNKKKYYLVHSFRHNKKIKKIRRFLGTNLSQSKIEQIKPIAEKQLIQRTTAYKKIADPLEQELSEKEIKEIKNTFLTNFKIFHLSEKQWELFSERFTYNTNAIEGSDINYKEVKDILSKNKWVKDKTKEDIAETYGVKEAINYIKTTKTTISINLIKKIHFIVFKNSKEYAGNFRSKGTDVYIKDKYGNIIHTGAPSEKINELLKELIIWYNKYKTKYPPILLGSIIHNQFENIHPFEDGNGRVGRILLNNILIKHQLPPVDITFKKRQEYYKALKEYQENKNIRPTIELLLKEYKNFKKRL
jgi:Fic family protein